MADHIDKLAAERSSGDVRLPLDGLRVTLLRAADFSIDARARKQATALMDAGAEVTLVGIGKQMADDLEQAPYDVRLYISEKLIDMPRWGREEVFWPVRVAVNLTYTKYLEWRYIKLPRYIYPYEPWLRLGARESNPDIIHAYDIQALPAAVAIAQECDAKVVYDCLDMYGDVDFVSAADRRMFRKAEADLLPRVDAVITVSDAMSDVFVERYGMEHPVAIYNGPSKVVDSASPAGAPVKLFFQGSFSADRNIEALVRSMQHLRPHATLSLQGFGGIHDYLVSLVDELDLGDVVEFVPACAPLEVVDCASRYDVGVVCHVGSDLNMDIAAPNKLMDYLGAGLAVAGSDLPGIRSVIGHTGAGVLIDPTDEHTIAASLLPLVNDPAAVSAMKARAVELARTYVWPVQSRRLIDVYQSIVGGQTASNVNEQE